LKDVGLEGKTKTDSVSKLWNGREYICFVCLKTATRGGFRHINGFTERGGFLTE